jgi:uncharacterized protein YdaT
MNRSFGTVAYNYGLNESQAKAMFHIINIYDDDNRVGYIATMKCKKWSNNSRRNLSEIKKLQNIWEEKNEKYILADREKEEGKLETLKEELKKKKRKFEHFSLFTDVQNGPPRKKLRRSIRLK